MSHRTVRDAAAGITVLAVANFVAITTEVLPVGLLPQLAAGLGVRESTAGLLVSVYAFVVAACAVPLTLATRRLPRKPLLLATVVVYAVANVVAAFAPSFGVVVAARTLGGVGHAVFFSVSIAYAARLVSPLYTGRSVTLVTAGGTAGFVLGVPLSTSLGAAVGWRWSFAVLAAVCALTAVLLGRVLPPVDAAPAAASTEQRGGRGRLALVVGTNTLLFVGQYTVYTYVSLLLLATGLAAASVGPALLVFGALGIVGLWAAGRYLDRRPRTLTLVTIAVMVAALAGVALALPQRATVLVGLAVWLAAFGAVPAAFQTLALRARGASEDLAGAFVNGTSNLGIGLGAALGSVLVAGPGLPALAWAGAGAMAVGGGIVLVARRAFPHDPTAAPRSDPEP